MNKVKNLRDIVRVKKEKVEEWLNQAEIFVRTLKRLVD